MEKNEERVALNIQDDEDHEVYTLHPEYAIADANHKKQNTEFDTALQPKNRNQVMNKQSSD